MEILVNDFVNIVPTESATMHVLVLLIKPEPIHVCVVQMFVCLVQMFVCHKVADIMILLIALKVSTSSDRILADDDNVDFW